MPEKWPTGTLTTATLPQPRPPVPVNLVDCDRCRERDSKIAQLEAKIKQQQREIMELRNELNRERSV